MELNPTDINTELSFPPHEKQVAIGKMNRWQQEGILMSIFVNKVPLPISMHKLKHLYSWLHTK